MPTITHTCKGAVQIVHQIRSRAPSFTSCAAIAVFASSRGHAEETQEHAQIAKSPKSAMLHVLIYLIISLIWMDKNTAMMRRMQRQLARMASAALIVPHHSSVFVNRRGKMRGGKTKSHNSQAEAYVYRLDALLHKVLLHLSDSFFLEEYDHAYCSSVFVDGSKYVREKASQKRTLPSKDKPEVRRLAALLHNLLPDFDPSPRKHHLLHRSCALVHFALVSLLPDPQKNHEMSVKQETVTRVEGPCSTRHSGRAHLHQERHSGERVCRKDTQELMDLADLPPVSCVPSWRKLGLRESVETAKRGAQGSYKTSHPSRAHLHWKGARQRVL